MVLTVAVVSLITFIVIQLPPGDFVTSYVTALSAAGAKITDDLVDSLRAMYGLDRPFLVQYLVWVKNLLTGNLGYSFAYNQSVVHLLAERLPLTIGISALTLLITYAIAVPAGIISAVKQYSLLDYLFTALAFLGLAVPSFLLALALMYVFMRFFGISVGGLFSTAYINAPWSWNKLWNLLSHLWVPIIVVGASGMGTILRVMRGTLLDELGQQYVETARAKGMPETRLIFKYPVRIALNPVVSTIGWLLPQMISGLTIVSIVLSLPTTGNLLLGALLEQDMYLAGDIVLLLSVLTVVGTLISDILLVWIDPRIRFGGRKR
jgi:peptide/nickel transport system permease protein